MIEIYSDIRQEVKDAAVTLWNFVTKMQDPVKAANFLSEMLGYYKVLYTAEEVEFLQFYLNMQMEMMKQ